MEGELKMTRKELETTKQALKVQAARCRHLVTAFTRKLAERDAELKACRQQREKQLSSLLRALLVLEARLRREQKSIKELLVEKDNLINNQKLEIERLRSEVKENMLASEVTAFKEITEESLTVEVPKLQKPKEVARVEIYAKPDLISSLGLPEGGGKDCGPDSLSSDSTRSCLGDESDYTVIAAPQVKGVLNVHNRSAFSPISKVKAERRLNFSPFSKSAPDVSRNAGQGEIPDRDNLLQEIRAEDEDDKYLDNPVLQCVNQILLKDQEDFLEEQRLRMKDGEGESMRARDWLDEEESPVECEPHEECGSQPMPLLEVVPIQKKSVSLTDLNKDTLVARLNPPLPPKPKIAGTKKVEFAPTVEFHNPNIPMMTHSQPLSSKKFHLSLSMLEPLDQGQDKDLYVISNSALDDEIVKQLRGRTLNVSGLHIKPQRVNNDMNQHSNVPTGSLHPNHNPRPKSPPTSPEFDTNPLFTPPRTPPSKVLRVNIQESPKRSSLSFMSPPKVGMPNMIKVASPVAALLTASGGADEVVKDDLSPSVSQMVRRFEDLGTPKKSDAEEGKDEVGTPSTASSAESSPARISTESSPNSSASSGVVSYDTFLEATGLSQKSIMTPSRMMTNHRNVTRPKDVKLRSKGKTAGVIERCIPPQVVGPTVKYWTEPFL
ncbi:Hypothetical protein NTJ_05704 [Nesidiocoris tenuis]|uniref:Uncharacterized protein n=1 Tax=Nesidiocoris tenuis TaxID=355587 RepID=A0ABN7ANN4_9HEMI|nr:Hypothetical protein NTJ_05704 [Nesidiocoris tenuis]